MYPTWALVFVTLGLAIYTAKLWGATKSLSEDAKNTSERQAGEMRASLSIAQKTADAAKQSADVAEEQRGVLQRQAEHLEDQAAQLRATVTQMKETAQRQLRAYVTMDASGFQDQKPADPVNGVPEQFFFWNVWIMNTGQTPAYDLSVESTLGIHPFPLPPNLPPTRDPMPNPSKSVLGTGQKKVAGGPYARSLPPSEWDEIRRGTGKRIYIYGVVYYRDAFGVKHTTNFCQFAGWADGKAGGEIFGGMTEQHNDAD